MGSDPQRSQSGPGPMGQAQTAYLIFSRRLEPGSFTVDVDQSVSSSGRSDRVEVESVASSPISSRAAGGSSLGLRVERTSPVAARRLDRDLPVCLRPVATADQLVDDHVSLSPFSRSTCPRSPRRSAPSSSLGRTRPEERLVASDAFVMPRMIGSNVACSFFSFLTRMVLALQGRLGRRAARAAGVRLTGALDADLLQHLPDDELDVLVVDLDALGLVDLLHLADEVQPRYAVAPLSNRRSAGLAVPRSGVSSLDHLAMDNA